MPDAQREAFDAVAREHSGPDWLLWRIYSAGGKPSVVLTEEAAALLVAARKFGCACKTYCDSAGLKP